MKWILKTDELPNAYEEVEIITKSGDINQEMIIRDENGNLCWTNHADEDVKAWRMKSANK